MPTSTSKKAEITTSHSQKRIVIALAVYNGAAFLEEQLESIAAQDHQNWSLLVSDDGSSDGSTDILRRFSEKGHDVTVLEGPQKGAAENFMSLIRRTREFMGPDQYLAFCDQDDVWFVDKLTRGMRVLANAPSDQMAMYCSRLWLADTHATKLRISPGRPRGPAFRNALIQNIASGNTIILNPKAQSFIQGAAVRIDGVMMHDWWMYQTMSAVGAEIIHDDEPGLLYRQHQVNELGANDTLKARWVRLRFIFDGSVRHWNDLNVRALSSISDELTAENLSVLNEFAKARHFRILGRVAAFYRLGLFRQSRLETAVFWVAVVLGRV